MNLVTKLQAPEISMNLEKHGRIKYENEWLFAFRVASRRQHHLIRRWALAQVSVQPGIDAWWRTAINQTPLVHQLKILWTPLLLVCIPLSAVAQGVASYSTSSV